MTRALFAVAAAIVAIAIYFGPAQWLNSGTRLQATNTALTGSTSVADPHAAHAAGVAAATASAGPAALPPTNSRVDVSVLRAAKPELGYTLGAELRTADGKPVSDATVRFYENVDLFGTREMLIASAVTDGRGQASVDYLPARLGVHDIVVRFSGKDRQQPAIGRTSFEGAIAAPAYQKDPPLLTAFSAGVPYVVGLVVLSVWAVIAFALFGTARGVIGGARGTQRKEGPA